jgi:ribosomal-protein-serine acetyltransferase
MLNQSKIPSPEALESPNLLLRPCAAEDEEEVFAAEAESIADLRLWFWWCHPSHSRARSAGWVRSRPSAWAAGQEYSYLIFHKSAPKLAGCVWLNAIDTVARRASLGYWVRSGCGGRGIGPEASLMTAKWGFARLSLLRIEIVIATSNGRSRRLAEKIGAQFEGIARNRLRVGEVTSDAWVYSLIPGDLQPHDNRQSD